MWKGGGQAQRQVASSKISTGYPIVDCSCLHFKHLSREASLCRCSNALPCSVCLHNKRGMRAHLSLQCLCSLLCSSFLVEMILLFRNLLKPMPLRTPFSVAMNDCPTLPSPKEPLQENTECIHHLQLFISFLCVPFKALLYFKMKEHVRN